MLHFYNYLNFSIKYNKVITLQLFNQSVLLWPFIVFNLNYAHTNQLAQLFSNRALACIKPLRNLFGSSNSFIQHINNASLHRAETNQARNTLISLKGLNKILLSIKRIYLS